MLGVLLQGAMDAGGGCSADGGTRRAHGGRGGRGEKKRGGSGGRGVGRRRGRGGGQPAAIGGGRIDEASSLKGSEQAAGTFPPRGVARGGGRGSRGRGPARGRGAAAARRTVERSCPGPDTLNDARNQRNPRGNDSEYHLVRSQVTLK